MPLTNPHLISRAIASATGTVTAANQIVVDTSGLSGILVGSASAQASLARLDGTGIGAAIQTFTGNFTAQTSNIDTWFGGRQQTRLRCTDNGGIVPPTFRLPGTTDLTTAFNQLSTANLPEVIRFVIEYTDTTSFLRVEPASGADPQIGGTSAIIIRPNVSATVEISRSGGVISGYVFQSIGTLADNSGSTLDAIKLINPSQDVWDASASGTLPSNAVVKGNAYQVVNAPADGTGRFGEVMLTDDWVVWDGETFTSWSATPHAWFVIPAHEVRRISALEQEFLNFTQTTAQSDRNDVTRGTAYADDVGEIRLKLYATRAAYSAADLNTTGDIDEYTDPSDQTAFLGIRLQGSQASLASVFPTLYVYSEDASGNFTRIANLDADFTFEGDFGAESDYLSREALVYNANDTWRIYYGTVVDRFNNPNLDISFENLDGDLQSRVTDTHGNGTVDEQRLSTLESKVATLFPLSPDVPDLTAWSDVFDPAASVAAVRITDGYSLIADYRGSATRYESAGVTYDDTGTNVVTYTGLGDNLFRTFGFKVNGPADQVLMWIVDGSTRIPFIDMTAAGNYRINSYTTATGEDEVVTDRIHFLTRSGDEILRPGTTDTSTYTIQPFPANADHTSRRQQIEIDILVNGTDTLAGGLIQFDLPADNTAQAQQTITHDEALGPLHGNRVVRTEIGYTLRVSGNDLLMDVVCLSAPSDVTIRLDSVGTLLSYTAPGAAVRVDNFQIFQSLSGNYTFAGENELLVTFQSHPFVSTLNAVGAAITAAGVTTEFNDRIVPIPGHSFASVEIPDTVALTGFEFRTFSPEHFLRHSDLSHLLTRRATQWAYGLALNTSISERQVTEAIDFTQGLVLTSPDTSRWLVAVDDAGALSTTKQP